MSDEVDVKLCDAAGRGAVGEIQRLIAAGANPNALSGDGTPLQKAAFRGHVDAITVLLQARARVDGVDSRGATPLMFAAVNNQTAALKALIAAGADVNRVNSSSDTALHYACMTGYLAPARALLDAGAVPSLHMLGQTGKRPIDVVRARPDHHPTRPLVAHPLNWSA